MTVKEVLNLIDDSGGISVLAHPFTIKEDVNLESLVFNMKKDGLAGIEIYPPKIKKSQLKEYLMILVQFLPEVVQCFIIGIL